MIVKDTGYAPAFRTLLVGWVLALSAILYGQGLGIAFGAFEDSIKDGLANSAAEVLETVYDGDEAAANQVVSKSWTYYKRAHLHANAMGTTAAVLVLLLTMLGGPTRPRQLLAAALGAGALGYGLFWMLAANRAPGMGGTGAAKETLEWLALPSAGLTVLGTVGTLVFLVWRAVKTPSPTA